VTAIDPGLLELIHAEIDGLNSESQHARLHELLARDPAAREYFGQMKSLSEALGRVKDLDPPADLSLSIMHSVRAAREQATGKSLSRLWLQWPGGGRSVLRYGYTFAAGMVLGFAGLQWYVTRPAGLLPVAPSEVAGTMTAPAAPEASALLQRIPLDLEDLGGTVSLLREHGGLALALDVHTSGMKGPIQVVLGFDPVKVDFAGLAQVSGQVRGFRAGSGELAWEMLGRHQLTVQLVAREEAGSQIVLRFLAAGAQVHSLLLSLPGQP
jgi:anti-sigma factor RsiW